MIFRISCSPGRANFQKNASGNKSALNQKQNGGLCGRPDFFYFFSFFSRFWGFRNPRARLALRACTHRQRTSLMRFAGLAGAPASPGGYSLRERFAETPPPGGTSKNFSFLFLPFLFFFLPSPFSFSFSSFFFPPSLFLFPPLLFFSSPPFFLFFAFPFPLSFLSFPILFLFLSSFLGLSHPGHRAPVTPAISILGVPSATAPHGNPKPNALIRRQPKP